MKLISHRGNINGKNPEMENCPSYIDDTINLGYEVEIDLWVIEKELHLGHDIPEYKIDLNWLNDRSKKLWIHCKNIEAMSFLNGIDSDFNYFWHQEDTVTLTSKNFIWAYPGKQPIKNSIAVMPEIYKDNTEECLGICSDYVSLYRK